MAIITSDFIDGPNHFALSNLKLQRNFVMRGQHDKVYVEGAVNKTVDFWRAMGAATVFDGVDLLPSGHGIPTDRCQVPPCVPCAENQSPFLVACNWDGAGHALQWMLGGGRPRALAPRADRSDPHAWSYFDQRPFGPSSPFSLFRTRMTTCCCSLSQGADGVVPLPADRVRRR